MINIELNLVEKSNSTEVNFYYQIDGKSNLINTYKIKHLKERKLTDDLLDRLKVNRIEYNPAEIRVKISDLLQEFKNKSKSYACKACGKVWTQPRDDINTICPYCKFDNSSEKEDKEDVIEFIKKKITIHDLERIYQKWLYLENPDAIHVLLATALSQQMEGDPVWLMFVAPPAFSKTELLRSLGKRKNKFTIPMGDLTSSALITGYKDGTDACKDMDGKITTIKDFTTILSTDDNTRRKVFATLRELYDGTVTKHFGGDVAKKEINAHTTIIGGVTPVIEVYKTFFASLGDRFLHYRIRANRDKATEKAMQCNGREKEMREELELWTLSFLEQQRIISVEISEEHQKMIMDFANFIAIVRTPVMRDHRNVVYCYPEPELATRLVKQLNKFVKCLTIVRGRSRVEDEDLEIIQKIALDTCPEIRVRMIGAIMLCDMKLDILLKSVRNKEKKYSPLDIIKILDRKTSKIAKECDIPYNTTKMHLEDLQMLKIVEKDHMDYNKDYNLLPEKNVVKEKEESIEENKDDDKREWKLNPKFSNQYMYAVAAAEKQHTDTVYACA